MAKAHPGVVGGPGSIRRASQRNAEGPLNEGAAETSPQLVLGNDGLPLCGPW
jgi:hypothetical protein